MDRVINLTLAKMYRNMTLSTPRKNDMIAYRRQATFKLEKLYLEIRAFAQCHKAKNAGF